VVFSRIKQGVQRILRGRIARFRATPGSSGPIPKVVFSRTLNSVAANARLAIDDIGTEVGRLRDQPCEGVVAIGEAGLAAAAMAPAAAECRRFVSWPSSTAGWWT